MEDNEKTRIPQQTLRELAPRALMILERHKVTDPVIALFEATLPRAATSLIESYDATHSNRMGRPFKSEAQRRAINHLWKRIDVWLAFLTRDVETFDATLFETSERSAVRVIAAAERLIAFINHYPADQARLPYADLLLADLTQALPVAQQDWAQSRASLNELQVRQTDTRHCALVFERELVAFQRALGNILGESNTDYQSLRVIRRSKPKDNNTTKPPATEPAPPPNAGVPATQETRH